MSADRLNVGPIGRLGRWTAGHFRIVAAAWVVVAVGLGVLAPRVEKALSGAGWEATGSESVQARRLIDKNFDGLGTYGLTVVVHAPRQDRLRSRVPAGAASGSRAKLKSDPAVATVVPPRAGVSISPDRHTAVIRRARRATRTTWCARPTSSRAPLARLGSDGVRVDLTGAAGMWSDFNQANRSAMMKSELISWPVTLAILVLAFGSLVAAGLPLMLTIVGLVAAAGSLWIGTQIADISIWSMNFALMFALALGIDYALFIVYRFRGAFFGSKLSAPEAVAATMDTAGKAVLFSGVTVLISLSAVMLVPSPAFRSTSLGIMLSVVFVLAATLTLLPAVLAKLGPRVDRFALPWVRPGEHQSPRSAAWAERLWRRPLRYGLAALVLLVVLALPVLSLKTAMPSIKVVPSGDNSREGYDAVQKAFGPGSTGPLQIVAPRAQAAQAAAAARRDPGIARVLPPQPGAAALTLVQAIPTTDPSARATGTTIDRLRAALPRGGARRRPGGGEPRPRGGAVGQDAAGDRRRARPQLPAAGGRAAGAADRRARRRHEPAGDRGRLRRREVDLPGRRRALGARLRAAGLPGRVGTGVLLRDDLRDLDGLHGVPARPRRRSTGSARAATPRRRWSAAWPARDA